MASNSFTFVLDDIGKQRALVQLSRATTDGSWEVVFQPHSAGRTLAQNRLIWVYNRQISDHLTDNSDNTFSPDDVHDWLCEQFLDKTVITIDGKPIVKQQGTSKLKVGEFSEYLDKVSHWAAERGIRFSVSDQMYSEAMGER